MPQILGHRKSSVRRETISPATSRRIQAFISTIYDAIIIGSGAGGGTLALHLARAGKSILILERGPFLPQEKLN